MFDVAIVGCGPVGATLANLLGQQGVRVAVLERDTSIYSQPRAGHFDGEVMRVFQSLGLADEIAAKVLVNPGMQFVSATGELLLDWPRPQQVGPEGWHPSYRFHQPFLEQALRGALAKLSSVDVYLGSEVTRLEHIARGLRLHYSSTASGMGSMLDAKFVIGCDGARSTVKRFMQVSNDDLGSHAQWLVIDLKLHRPREDLPRMTIQWCDPARPMTMACGIEGRRRWEIMLMPGDDIDAVATPEFFWPLIRRWVRPGEAEVERAVVYAFHALVARQWRVGRALLAGDACHQMPPFMGQGMCAGIRDAANLGWKLAAVLRGTAQESLLDTYQTEREPHLREFIGTAVRLGAMIHVIDPAKAAERDAQFKHKPPAMSTPQPSLGPGVHGLIAKPAGTRAAQPRTNEGRLIDEIVGHRFALLARQPILTELQSALTGHNLAFLGDQHVEVSSYLREMDSDVVIVRPDRYILGVANSTKEAQRLLERVPSARAPSA
jgi:3-(3-hydroxy-phenyl)propionate hydroxylase